MRLSGSVYSKILDMDTGLTIVTPNKLREGKYKVCLLYTSDAADEVRLRLSKVRDRGASCNMPEYVQHIRCP